MQQTHYDILKVSRDAPIEVIRAAYRVLCQKYHPDRHPADPAATETMGLLNMAYEVLSDPERRHAYDASIRHAEAESFPAPTSKMTAVRSARVRSERGLGSDPALGDRIALHFRQCGILYGSALLALGGLVVVLSIASGPQMKSWVAATPSPEDHEAYIRRLARDVMQGRGDDAKRSLTDPTLPGSAPAPSEGSSALTAEPETPGSGEEVSPNNRPLRLNNNAGPATPPRESTRAPTELPSVSQTNEAEPPSLPSLNEAEPFAIPGPNEAEAPAPSQPNKTKLPIGSQPNEAELPSIPPANRQAVDRTTSSAESHQDNTGSVTGTE